MRKDFILILIILGLISVQAVAQKIIDVHCYNILPSYIETLDRHDAALEETFPLPTWNVESHLAFMKGAGIECSVLTMPAPQPWFGDVLVSLITFTHGILQLRNLGLGMWMKAGV